ncbi:MAG: wax ester/triacylglycerol synthase family O-acyltransferase [Solirubrobacteraceae bacterium]
MDRLTALDASFLRVETPNAHMHVGWLATVDLPAGADALGAEDVVARIAGRLHHLPRFRQVIREPPGGLVAPYWADAEHFDIAEHVRVDTEARPSLAALHALAEEFFSEQLPRDRPLWELLVVPRLAGRRAAILGKVHHAMVDGVAAVQLGLLLFDGDSAAGADLPVPWRPQPDNAMRSALTGARDTALEQFRSARRVAELGLSPGRGLRMADTARRAAFSLVDDVRRPAPPSYLNVPIGPRRRLVGATLPLGRALAIKERTDTKLNDVVLATVAGALARLAPAHGEDAIDLRAMVPDNVRGGAGADAQGNAISFLFVDLPVQSRPAERLKLLSARMRALKDDDRIAGSDQVMKMLGYLPGPLQGQAARLAASPRLYNVTVSNVPGPRIPLYLAGGRVRSILPVIPIPDHHALAIGALTYENRLHLSAYLDPEILPRAGGLPVMLADAFHELELATAA